MHQHITHKKILLVITTLQEAFTAIIPFFFLNALIALTYFLSQYLHLFKDSHLLPTLLETFNAFSSIVVSITIAYFFAIRLKVSEIIAAILSLATFITILLIESSFTTAKLPHGFTPANLLNPIVSTWFLAYYLPKFSLNIPLQNENRHIYQLFNYLFVFLAAYFSTVFLYYIVDIGMDYLIDIINQLHLNFPPLLLLGLRDFFIQIFWFFGIHGEHTINALFGKEILDTLMFPSLTYGEFNRLFIAIGGAGIGIGLWIALILYAKERTLLLITKLSFPFILFNINTLLIYAIIILNRFLILPFILLPLFNLLVAYSILQWIPQDFTTYHIAWMTPPFLDGYLKSNGSIVLFLLQLFLLVADTLVYIYFVKRFISSQSIQHHKERLEENLEIPNELRSKEYVHAFYAQKEIIAASAKVGKISHLLTHQHLHIYYQPKVDIKHQQCEHFEALLRLEGDKGKMTGPYFLDTLENAGMAPVIDIWVCREVAQHLERWKEEKYTPNISINLHPDTINSYDAMTKIIHLLQGEKVVFEIIERTFLLGKQAERSLQRLQENNFAIVIDDFGTGYSSLETITKHTIKELKLDKSLIDIIEEKKGFLVCKHTVNLCHEMGCAIVAEGVETKKQLEIVQSINVDFVQGYYFSPAIPFEEVQPYTKTFTMS